MIWFLVIVPGAIALIFFYLVPRFVLDQTYSPHWMDFQCHGSCRKGAALVGLLLFLLLSLPVWFKALATGSAISEILARWMAYLVWTFDRRPDFAIGPYGIYGLCGLKYFHVLWPNVSKVSDHHTRTVFGTMRSLIFETTMKRDKSWLTFRRKPSNVRIALVPAHGFDLDEIRSLVATFAPGVRIAETKSDIRPWLFRW